MASDVAIANRALVKVGAERITSLSDPSKAARTINSLYTILREAELRANVWSFSLKRASIAADVTTPDWGYDYQYTLPSDFLRLVTVRDAWVANGLADYKQEEEAPFSIEAGAILTNLVAPLEIRYVYRVTDPATFDASFVEALACKIAMEIAEPLTQSNSKRQLAQDEYRAAIALAKRTNAIERPPIPIPDDTWILSRL